MEMIMMTVMVNDKVTSPHERPSSGVILDAKRLVLWCP